MNRFQVRAGQEGIYEVSKSRALHWPSADGKPVIWATAGQFVDLRGNFLCELVQKTGQMHKVKKVDAVPAGARLLRAEDAPAVIRDALRAYEAGKPGIVAAPRTAADSRKIDVSQLPSAKAPAAGEVIDIPEPKHARETVGSPDPKADDGVSTEKAPEPTVAAPDHSHSAPSGGSAPSGPGSARTGLGQKGV